MRYLLDTNICIYLIKRSPPTVMRRFKAVRVGEVALSAITLCELQFGVSNSARPDANQAALIQFLAPFEVRDLRPVWCTGKYALSCFAREYPLAVWISSSGRTRCTKE